MEPFIGQIQAFGFNFAARGWALCDGQIMAISQNTALFSLIGTTFGGDGRTTFALPDLRGRSIVHPGHGPGLSPVTWGQRGGAEQLSLTVNNIPSHNHNMNIVPGSATSDTADQKFLAHQTRGGGDVPEIYSTGTPSSQLSGGAITATGGGQPFWSRNPYLGIYVSIALFGVFPSRS